MQPTRDARGRRSYTDDDVRSVQQIAGLVRAGHAIGDIAAWSDEKRERIAAETVLEQEDPGQGLREQLFARLDADELHRFEQLVATALTTLSPLEATEEVLAPVLGRIGALWRDDALGADQEHALSMVIKRQLLLATAYLAPSAQGPHIVFSTLTEEQHEFGVLMASYVASAERCKCTYLGPNLPARDLIQAMRRLRPSALALGVVCADDPERIEDELCALAAEAPEEARIILGIGAAASHAALAVPPPIVAVRDLAAFQRMIASF